jgi:hypothetical protein
MLSLKQLKDVCLNSDVTSQRCRYLCQDEVNNSKFYCLKLSAKAGKIDAEIDNYVKTMKSKGKNPDDENLPLGDNCSGYPFLRHIEQGYDKKS